MIELDTRQDMIWNVGHRIQDRTWDETHEGIGRDKMRRDGMRRTGHGTRCGTRNGT